MRRDRRWPARRPRTGPPRGVTARRGRVWYLPLLLSDHGRDIMARTYDAFTTEGAYVNRASGRLGPLGSAVDRIVLNLPIHATLRQRLALVVDELAREVGARENRLAARPTGLGTPTSGRAVAGPGVGAAARGERTPGTPTPAGRAQPDRPGRSFSARGHEPEDWDAGAGAIRVLSAPCGLCRDLLLCADRLAERAPALRHRVDFTGLDLDARGDVLPEAARRARAAGVAIALHRGDIFDPAMLAVPHGHPRFDIVTCIGLTAWRDLDEVELLARRLRDLAAPDATLIVDNWAPHTQSALGRDLEIDTRYHEPRAFVAALRRGSFVVDPARTRTTPNGVCALDVARATAHAGGEGAG